MKVVVRREELLKELRANREAHREIFLKAQEGFKMAVIGHLEDMLADARNGKRVDFRVNLPQPIDQTKEYDRAIKMFEMAVEETVVLEEHEFAQYVMDDWSWKDQFTVTNTRYMK